MDEVAVLDWMLLLCNPQDLAFFNVESHLSLLLPLLEHIKILLEFYAVPLDAYFPVA